jgi:hypothetical protein
MEQEEKEFISKINKELNINGKFLITSNISFVFYGYSSSLNIADFIKINNDIKRLIPINISPVYNFDSFTEWKNSYDDIKASKYLLVFKNSDLIYYRLNTKNI